MKKQYLTQIVLVGSLVGGMMLAVPNVNADDSVQLKEQVQALQNRVDQLESQLASRQQSPMVAAVDDQWEDPFAQMMLMRQQMERNMRQAFVDTGAFNPRMDVKQTDKEYIITMDVPGMDKNKINVEVKEGVLIISGERKSEIKDNKNNQYYRQERSFGTFLQEIPLPEDAKSDHVDANYTNGVLTVTVARMKKEEKKSAEQRIMVK